MPRSYCTRFISQKLYSLDILHNYSGNTFPSHFVTHAVDTIGVVCIVSLLVEHISTCLLSELSNTSQQIWMFSLCWQLQLLMFIRLVKSE